MCREAVVSCTSGGPLRDKVRFSTLSSPRTSAMAWNLTHGSVIVSVMVTCGVIRLKSVYNHEYYWNPQYGNYSTEYILKIELVLRV